MDNSLFVPITNLIEKSQNILVLCHAKPDPDALGSSLSFYLAMKQLGKQVTVVTNEPAKENMAFLPAMDTLHTTLGGTKDFIISIDTKSKSISKIKYNAEDGRVNIIITPKDGVFMADDVSFRAGKNQYDLIVAFDTGNVEYFGKIYDNNVQLFFETPIINIDHHASNTDYGQLNLVLPTAASTTEILYDYLVFLEKRHNKKLIDADIATLLLAGLITDTGSFQHANTSPRALEVAAELLDLGGRQQEIIKHFFKTKKLSTLKLWGMILSKVQVDPLHRMVWSTISHEDFLSSEAEPEETEGIIDDLLTNAPGAEVIFLIKQNKDYVSISFRSTANGIDVGKLCADNGGGGHPRAAGFKVPGQRAFDEVVAEVVKKVREFQAKRLNIFPEEVKIETGNPKLETNKVAESKPPVAGPGYNHAPGGTETGKATESKPIARPGYNPAPGENGANKASETKPVAGPESNPAPANTGEKKVTYLDFPSKQEAIPVPKPKVLAPKPIEPALVAKPVVAEAPKATEPAPMAKPAEAPISKPEEKGELSFAKPIVANAVEAQMPAAEAKPMTDPMPKVEKEEPAVAQAPAPVAEPKPEIKPVKTTMAKTEAKSELPTEKIRPVAAKPMAQGNGAVMPEKKPINTTLLKKHHRKRHHKKKVEGGLAEGKTAPQTKSPQA